MGRNDGPRDLLLAWLNDAYAMEQTLIPVLENHARDARHNPEVSRRIQDHAEETRRHADMVRSCVERMGSTTSTAKNAMSWVIGRVQAVTTGMFRDELVKNNLSDIAAEHFEIACYHSLITAARDLGEHEIANVCQQILHEEEDMAHFLEQQLERTTLDAMHEYAATMRR